MRILHVITSLHTGGAEKLVVDLLPRMRNADYDVELCVFDGTETPFRKVLEDAGIKVYSFHKGVNKVYSPTNIWYLYRLIKNGNYDIVHSHLTAPQLFTALCGVLCSVVLITTEHTTSNRRRDWKWYAWLDKWMYRQYKEIICISDQAEINLRKYIGEKNSSNVCTIYNGIDFNKYFCAKPASDIRLISTKIITNVAGFRNEKDHPTLIRAMQYLPDEFHLCLVGDGVRKPEYERLIKELRLSERIHLLGLRNDIPEVLAASNYIVMCSHYEGLSLSSLEGMASGKPFLADNVDGLREIVEGNGVLFEHEDSKGFAEEILRLDNNNEYAKSIIYNCQNKSKQYDISITVCKYLRVYKKYLQ